MIRRGCFSFDIAESFRSSIKLGEINAGGARRTRSPDRGGAGRALPANTPVAAYDIERQSVAGFQRANHGFAERPRREERPKKTRREEQEERRPRREERGERRPRREERAEKPRQREKPRDSEEPDEGWNGPVPSFLGTGFGG